jgi:DNA-binding LacI/PurR family transcriptional regulator
MATLKGSRKPRAARKTEKTVTMRDIASHARVSIGTVSHVINGTAGVRPEVSRRVKQAMRGLDYQPSQLARGLRRKRTNMLGMIVPDITNPFFPLVVRGVEDTAYREGYRLVLCNADNDPAKEEKYLEDLLSYRMAGLIIIPSVDSRILSILNENRRENRVICVDRAPDDWTGDSVTVDNEEGAYKAVRYLIGMGHRCIATITGPLHVPNAIQRVTGYRRALAEAGIEVGAEYIQEGRFERISGYQKAQTLLRLLPRPTAIFAANDLIALGILAALREARISCPDDMSVVGFDDLEVTFFTDPPLTTVAQPAYQLGAKAATVLLNRMNQDVTDRQILTLETELRIRQSVRPIEAAINHEFLTRTTVR